MDQSPIWVKQYFARNRLDYWHGELGLSYRVIGQLCGLSYSTVRRVHCRHMSSYAPQRSSVEKILDAALPDQPTLPGL